jgi:pimeloyl-ACP methyl ester carboxylesterase
MATFVLVHGAWHGGWCYARVARLLRAAGHDVYTPTLTGVGERAHLAALSMTLTTHVRDIVNVLEYENLSDVILCGHSYGGMVITGVAAAAGERIRTLFYLDAFLPEDGSRCSTS